MKLKSLFSSLLLGASLMAGTANAALVSVDWKTAGDGAISKDTATNLGWLDLTVTKGMSINGVLYDMVANGSYFGFRLPTANEIYGLLSNLSGKTFNTTPQMFSNPIDATATDVYGYLSNQQVGQLGMTWRNGSMVQTRGLYLNDAGKVSVGYVMQRTTAGGDINYVVSGSSYTYSTSEVSGATGDYSAYNTGVWLVKDLSTPELNDVPVSSAGIALIGMFLIMRRRTRQ